MNIRAAGMSFAMAGFLASSGQAYAAGELIVNEYNAVNEAEFMEFASNKPWEGQDSYFGRILGNGGNWIELVVTSDHLDIRNWTLEWSNSDPDDGVVTFSNDARWSDLRSGTIITIIESVDDLVPSVSNIQDNDFNDVADAVGDPFDVSTDFSFDPGNDDWWVNAWLSDATLFTTGSFKVDNDDWQVEIKDNLGATVSGPIGEDRPEWTGGGINSQEIGRLEADPSTGVTGFDYDDGDYSTFGSPNNYDDQTAVQDFSALRAWFVPTLEGDLNGDGFVGVDDLNIVLVNWNQNVTPGDLGSGDPTGEGFVGVDDLNIVLVNWNNGTPPASGAAVPEPASLALLGLGGVAALRRSRRG